MTQKVFSILELTTQLSDLKSEKAKLHALLIQTNRATKAGIAISETSDDIRSQIANLNSMIRSMEHDLSILTLTILKTAAIEETPYGRVIKYQEEDNK